MTIRPLLVLGIMLLTNGCVHSLEEPVASSKDSQFLERLVHRAVQGTLEEFAAKKLATNQLAVTLVDLKDKQHPARASYRGDVQIYPASVIKLFYLVAAHRWMED